MAPLRFKNTQPSPGQSASYDVRVRSQSKVKRHDWTYRIGDRVMTALNKEPGIAVTLVQYSTVDTRLPQYRTVEILLRCREDRHAQRSFEEGTKVEV